MPKYFEEDSLDEEFDLGEDLLGGADSFDDDGEMGEFEPEDFAALGIDPYKPTRAKPGSEAKVLMLSARYAAGLPLWHNEDCYEHGPREFDLMGTADMRR
jgi:hypothetical protein